MPPKYGVFEKPADVPLGPDEMDAFAMEGFEDFDTEYDWDASVEDLLGFDEHGLPIIVPKQPPPTAED